MREASVSCFLSVGCREGLRGLDVRGEIGGLGSDEFALFLIYNERDQFCFENSLIDLHGFQRIDHFFDRRPVFYDHVDYAQFYLERSVLWLLFFLH